MGRGYELLKDDLDYSDFADGVVGDDPNHIEMIWNKVYRRFGTLGSRGLGTTLCAGLDMALWDIKGKALGRPVYDLLGGPVRDDVRLYSHPASPDDIDACVADAKRQVAAGYKALKTDPVFCGNGQTPSPLHPTVRSPLQAAHTRSTLWRRFARRVGPDIELLIDAHGNFDVATATDLCNKMMPYDITWFEEPLQPESTEALRQLKSNTDMPLCIGERKFNRWDFVPVLTEGLVNFIMPDICWSGGISEMKKMAILAESFYIPISPHDASGAFNVIAGAQVMITVPNFYRLEMNDNTVDAYNSVLTEPLDIRDGLPRAAGQAGTRVRTRP